MINITKKVNDDNNLNTEGVFNFVGPFKHLKGYTGCFSFVSDDEEEGATVAVEMNSASNSFYDNAPSKKVSMIMGF
jgi:hypothetical protein